MAAAAAAAIQWQTAKNESKWTRQNKKKKRTQEKNENTEKKQPTR